MENAVFNAIVEIQRVIGFVIPSPMVIVVFLSLRQQKRFGNFVADLDETVLMEERVVLAQIDDRHERNLQTSRRTDSLKLPVLLVCVIGQKTLHRLA